MLGKGLIASTLALAAGLIIDGSHVCNGIVEENDMWIPEAESGIQVTTGISEVEYNKILDRFEQIYAPVFSDLGKTLVINRQWDNGTVNAFAQQFFWRWMVTFPGGLPRHPAITADGFALVVCHEIGHHLGGFPKNFWPAMSVEGQADYFANTKCLRQYFTRESNLEFFAHNQVDEYAIAVCQEMFSEEHDWMTCARGAMAGMSVSSLFQDLRKENRAPDFQSPDPTVIDSTNSRHPGTQCRLDTYFAGSICTQNANIPFSRSNEEDGACTLKQGFEVGMRPLCWFAPSR